MAALIVFSYFAIVFVTLGALLAVKDRDGRDPSFGDVFAALVWPAALLVALGFSMVRR